MSFPSIPLQTAKDHLRVEHDLDDQLIALLMEAAVERTLAEIGLAGCLEARIDTVASATVTFYYPVESISLVESTGSASGDDDWEELDTEDWVLSGNYDTRHKLVVTPEATRYRITWEPGFDVLPSWFQVAALFLLGHYYENRSAIVVGQGVSSMVLPMAFQHLTGPHKWIHFA